MSYSRLGQITTTQTRVVYRQPFPVSPLMYPPGVVFARNQAGPGQLYNMSLNPQEVEKAVYKDVPTTVKEESVVEGTTPQKIIKLKSGLEVPAYILQRDIARKQEAARQEQAIIDRPLARFHKAGVFIAQKPAQASLMALALGYFCGQIFYDFRH